MDYSSVLGVPDGTVLLAIERDRIAQEVERAAPGTVPHVGGPNASDVPGVPRRELGNAGPVRP